MKDTAGISALISEDEKAKRKDAIDFARRSVQYEGVTLDKEIEGVNQQYINGELTIDEFSLTIDRILDKRHEQWQVAQKN